MDSGEFGVYLVDCINITKRQVPGPVQLKARYNDRCCNLCVMVEVGIVNSSSSIVCRYVSLSLLVIIIHNNYWKV